MPSLSLKEGLDNVLRRIYSKKGDVFVELMLNWKVIVGDEFAKQIVPSNITYYKANGEKVACLSLKLTGKDNLLELQFSKLIILERINIYLGYKAISNIKFCS